MFILFSDKEDKINIPDPPTRTNNYNNFGDAMELYAIPDVAAHYEVVRAPTQSYALYFLYTCTYVMYMITATATEQWRVGHIRPNNGRNNTMSGVACIMYTKYTL